MTVAVVLAFLAGLLVVLPDVGAQDDDFNCSVEAAEGGIVLSWSAVEGATQYQYKLDVDGRGSDYKRVSGTSALVALADGLVGTIGLAPVMADGSGPSRINCGSASPLEGTGEQTLVCSVESVDGGINVSWNEIRGAVTYAYRLSVPDRSSRYQRMTGTSTFIGLPDGVTGTVAMTPVFADGSTRSRVPCGSGAPLEGTGTVDLICSVVSDPGGVRVSWNNIPGAVTFGYRLRVEGRGDSYGRVNGRSAVIAVEEGVLATIGMNPVAADGSTVARMNCGSAVGGGSGSGGGDPLTVATCTSTANGTAVNYAWTVAGDAGDEDFSNFRINYSVARPGEGFAEVARTFNINERSYVITLEPGDVVTSSIRVTYDDQTRSAAIPCGTVTIPAANEPLTIADCSVSDDGNNVVWNWTTAGNAEPTDSYRLIYQVQRAEGDRFSEAATLVDTDLRTFSFELRAGDIVSGTLRVDYAGNVQSGTVDCGEVIIGGVISGPECFATQSPLSFSLITGAEFYRITLASDGLDDRAFDVSDNTPFEFTGEPGTVLNISIQAFFPDGSATLNTLCGSVRIPDAV